MNLKATLAVIFIVIIAGITAFYRSHVISNSESTGNALVASPR